MSYRYGSYQMACAQAAQHEDDRQAHAFAKAQKQGVEWIDVGLVQFSWKKQSPKAVFFENLGWVPKTALAWKRLDTGEIVRWGAGRDHHKVLLIAKWFTERNTP